MELRHFRSFLAIAEHGHFRRAADSLRLAQSALSRHLRALEAEIGAPLVQRDTRNFALTPAGELLRDELTPLLEGLDASIARVRRQARLKQDAIRFACPPYLIDHLTPPLQRRLASTRSTLRLDVRELFSADALDALRRGWLDAALVNVPPGSNLLLYREVAKEPLIVLLSASHRLARRRALRLRDLAEEQFVICPRYQRAGFHELLLGKLKRAGLTPEIATETDSRVLTLELVVANRGVALLPASAAPMNPKCVAVPITDREAEISHYLVWRSDAVRPSLDRFLRVIESVTTQLRPKAPRSPQPQSDAAAR